jgi:PAS domain S-box-containing protein
MTNLYTTIALLTAGALLTIGFITLLIALKGSDRTNLIFGLMALSMALYFIYPPEGFVLNEVSFDFGNLMIKRSFMFVFYALMPWYIIHYSGYHRKWIAYVASSLVVISYTSIFILQTGSTLVIALNVGLVLFGVSSMFLGFAAARWQYTNQRQEQAKWLLAAMILYTGFYSLMTADQFFENFLGDLFNNNLIFPLHLHAVVFTLLMGLKVTDTLIERLRSEEISVKKGEVRWQSLMDNAPFIVMETDREGRIEYMNAYGVKLLGYEKSSELLGASWCQKFLQSADGEGLKQLQAKAFTDKSFVPRFKNVVKTKKGELFMSWVSFISNQEDPKSIISIGTDVTREESVNNLVAQLQQELEKEKVVLPENTLSPSDEIVGSGKSLHYAISKAYQVASTLTPVLLEGETGVGKEVFANMIHAKSSRSHLPFIKVNCGALPKELIEDELFGHEKGAFTSAIQARKGRFELADGGTIFLDEIGELPLDMQTRLLRVLQNGEFERVGGQKTIKVDVRVIAATNRKLAVEVQNNHFRSDLYYRLNVFPITIPPLRKRKEDLPELIHYFIARKSKKHNKPVEHISKANMQRLMEYPWPGNVRELKNVIERSVIETDNRILSLEWWQNEEESAEVVETTSLERIEKDHIVSIMDKCHWKINGDGGAAEMLGMHPNTLRSRMKKLGISRPQSAKSESNAMLQEA